jgi:hypothetical protein
MEFLSLSYVSLVFEIPAPYVSLLSCSAAFSSSTIPWSRLGKLPSGLPPIYPLLRYLSLDYGGFSSEKASFPVVSLVAFG